MYRHTHRSRLKIINFTLSASHHALCRLKHFNSNGHPHMAISSRNRSSPSCVRCDSLLLRYISQRIMAKNCADCCTSLSGNHNGKTGRCLGIPCIPKRPPFPPQLWFSSFRLSLWCMRLSVECVKDVLQHLSANYKQELWALRTITYGRMTTAMANRAAWK